MPERRKEALAVSTHAAYDAPKVWPSGRCCASEGCEVVLSKYNPGDRCGEHEKVRDRHYPCSPGQERPRRKTS